MTAARNLERDFQNLYMNESDGGGGGSLYSSGYAPQTRQIAAFKNAAKPPHPQKCEIEIPGKFRIQIQAMGKTIHVKHGGLSTYKPVVYPNPELQDSGDEEYPPPPPPIQSATYRSIEVSPTQSRMHHTEVYRSPSAQHSSTTVYTVHGSPAHRTAPLPGPGGDRGLGPGGDRGRPQPDFPPPPPPEAFYDPQEGEEYLAPPTANKVTYGNVTSAFSTAIGGRISPKVYTSGGRAGSPYQEYDRKSPVSVPTEKYPPPEGVRSRIMYTKPALAGGGHVQGVAQSRPSNVSGSSAPGPSPSATTSTSPASTPTTPHISQSSAAYPCPQPSSPAKTLDSLYSSRAQPLAHEHAVVPPGEGKEAEVDALTNLLVQNMEASADPDFYGMCARCRRAIMGENTGCSALDQLYHVECFSCVTCGTCLGGQPFFAMESKPYCEKCYMTTLEQCSVCSKPITERILRATGKPYHPTCFICVVCGKSLDGIPFTVDATNQIHCIEDFHKKFAPRCCVCSLPIMPESGQEETVRIVAMDQSFHVHCYTCEDCGIVLSSEAEGRGCYPLDDHILCKNCNAKRIQAMTTKMTTEL